MRCPGVRSSCLYPKRRPHRAAMVRPRCAVNDSITLHKCGSIHEISSALLIRKLCGPSKYDIPEYAAFRSTVRKGNDPLCP